MRSDPDPSKPGDPWARYVPDADAPWDLRRVVHLHRRAGFAATWDEIRRDLKDGPEASIDRLLAGKARSRGVPADFAAFADRLADLALAAPEPNRLKGWWVYRMLFGPDPLTERLTLMWHDHFATSNLKVNDLALMRRQNETLRSLGRGPVRPAAARDAPRPGAPGLARRPGEYQGPPQREPRPRADGAVHPRDRPLFRGRRQAGRPRPDRLEARGRRSPVRPGAARRGHQDDPRPHRRVRRRRAGRGCSSSIPRRPAGWPGGSATSSSARGRSTNGAIDALAEGLRAHDLDIGWGVATVLRSRRFFDAANLGRRIASPIEYVVGAVRALEMFDPAPSTPVLADWCGRLGQDLFYPPNVGGWPGGRAWITTRSAIGRANFAAALVDGESVGLGTPFDPIAWPRAMASGGTRRSSRNCCSVPTAPRSRSMSRDRPGRPLTRLLASPEAQRI